MKKVVIAPVFLTTKPRVTSYSPDWLRLAATKLVDYFRHQSGGRLELEFEVLDWIEAPWSLDHWMSLGFNVHPHVKKLVVDATGFDFSPFDHCMVLIDVPEAGGGVAPNANDTIIAATDASPWIMSHELGHSLGAGHTILNRAPDESIEYGGPYSPMGGSAVIDGSLSHPHFFRLAGDLYLEGGYNRTMIGPNMCVPNLVQLGWLDVQKHVRTVPTVSGGIHSSFRMYMLDGAPPPDAGAYCVAFRVEDGDVFVGEFRGNAKFYDQNVPIPNPEGTGWLVIYRMPADGSWVANQVAEIPARPGESISLQDPALPLLGSRPLSVSIVSFDRPTNSIWISVNKRNPTVPKYERTEELMDFLQWGIADAKVLGGVDEDIKSGLKVLARLHHLRVLERVAGSANPKGLRDAQADQARRLHSLSERIAQSALTRASESTEGPAEQKSTAIIGRHDT